MANEAKAFPSMESLYQNRDANIKNFTLFADNLLKVAVGVLKFKDEVTTMKISNFCSTSNEAFVLLSIENSYDQWNWEWTHGKKEGPGKPEKKYTSNAASSIRFGGWSREGKEWYNELQREVEKARKKKDRKDLEAEYLANQRCSGVGNGGGRKRKAGAIGGEEAWQMVIIDTDDESEEEEEGEEEGEDHDDSNNELEVDVTYKHNPENVVQQGTA